MTTERTDKPNPQEGWRQFRVRALVAIMVVVVAVGLVTAHITSQPLAEKQTRSKRMTVQSPTRLTYEDSCKLLQQLGYFSGPIPPLPDHRPAYGDDEPLGLSFFRTRVAEGKMENLTLRRTFFGKSEVGPISFKNTDLSESTLCWNDFNDVNFTDCDLSDADLRASIFVKVRFVQANLRNADLRQSSFHDCDFTDATMLRAKLTRSQGAKIQLSDQQRAEIDWQLSDGDEPGGG